MTCRICYETDPDGELLSVCGCTGSLALVHKECIEKWIRISKRKKCEICHQPYTIEVKILTEWTAVAGIIFGSLMAIIHALFVCHHIDSYPNDPWSVFMISIMVNAILLVTWLNLRWYPQSYQKLAVFIWIFIFVPLSLYLQSFGNGLELAAISYALTVSIHVILGFFSFYNVECE